MINIENKKDELRQNYKREINSKKNKKFKKNDLSEEEKKLAKELDAIFVCTSAKLGNGIDDLFKIAADKFLNPDKNISQSYMNKKELIEYENKIKIEEIRKKQNKKNIKKKKCC